MRKTLIITGCLLAIIITLFYFHNRNNDNNFIQKQNIAQMDPNEKRLLKKIERIDFYTYKNKEVGELLQKLNYKIKKTQYIMEPPGILQGMVYILTENISIEIYASDLSHIQRFSSKMNWDKELFKKEKINRVKILLDDMPYKEY